MSTWKVFAWGLCSRTFPAGLYPETRFRVGRVCVSGFGLWFLVGLMTDLGSPGKVSQFCR